MRTFFRKISALGASALLTGMTMGVAAAANFPSPFVVGSTADVAIVYGANAASLDIVQSANIQTTLQSKLSGGTTGTTASVTGEAAALFTSGTKLYINDSLNSVKTILTKADLPTVLADESFSGNVDATITQKIEIGSNPSVTFKKQPTSSDDPNLALTTSTTQTNYIYNATATFNKAVNLSHTDSEGESITLFGQTFTIGSASDADTLILLKSAEKVSLTSNSPTADVTVGGETYTVELVSASDTAATIAITDSSGTTESKEISEAASKKVNGVTVAITTADETNLLLSASVIVGADKLTIEDGSSVTIGEDNTVIDGTLVDFGSSGISTENMTSLTISVYASESDEDAIKAGESFVDPVFGSFKLDFSGFNIGSVLGEDDSARETITFNPNSDDKLDVTFTDHRGNEATIVWAKNTTTSLFLSRDDDVRNISVYEADVLRYQDYVVVGNEDEGYLLKLANVKNQSSGYSTDVCKFTDVFSGDTYDTVWTADGTGTLVVGGKSFAVTMTGAHTNASEAYTVRLNYPDSSGNGVSVMYPTIQTSKGARLAFYEPTTITITAWDGTNALTEVKFPDGDGYTSVSSVTHNIGTFDVWNFTAGGSVNQLNTTAAGSTAGGSSFTATVGKLTYNFTNTGTANQTTVYLQTVGGVNIVQPAVMIFEEKDDNSEYQAIIVEVEAGATGDDGIGIDTIEDTWSKANSGWSATRASDSKKTDRADLFGSIMTVDASDSDQKTGTISYPDEQVYAQIYIAEESASITAGTTGSTGSSAQLGNVMVTDGEVSSVSSKNLIIVGGSCINSAAATALGVASPTCGSAFTDATGVGSGEFLIKGVDGAFSTGKLALVVAGYEAADTRNAAEYLQNQVVDTSKEYKGTTATSATLVTTAA